MTVLCSSWRHRPSTSVLAALALAGGLVRPVLADETARAPMELSPVTVTGSGYETESTRSYKSDLVSVGEKDARSPKEIPQSTTVLTREYLDDRNASSLDTALRHTPGIVVLDNDNGRSSLYSRGFEFDSLYFNGLPAPLSSIYGTQPDMVIVDHVEILKGPAGLFGGAGEPAGAINMHLKHPQDDFTGSVALTGGSWGTVRGDADVSVPLNESKTVRTRFVAAEERQDGWVKNNDSRLGVGYGTIEADLDPMTTANFTFSHLERDITPYNGLPTYANGTLMDVSTSTTTGEDWNDFTNNVNDYIGELERHFSDGGHAKVSVRYSDRSAQFLYGYAATAANAAGVVNGVRWLARDYDEDSLAVDAHVSKPVTILGQEHNILIGADYKQIDSKLLSGTGVISGSYSIFNWNTSLASPKLAYSTQTDTKQDQYGLYGQVRIKPADRVTLIGGGRGTWYKSDVTNLLTGANSSSVRLDGEATPYGGMTVDVTHNVTAYASYTTIFQPQSDVDASGKTLAPREGHQYEAGVKGEFLDNSLTTSAAYFDLRDKNRSTTDNLGNYVAMGEIESRGVEMEATGNLRPNWQVMAGYTYTLSQYLNGVTSGTTYSGVTPTHMVQLWTKYRLTNGGWSDNLFFGGGLKVFSDTTAISSGQSITAAGYQTVDLQIGYDIVKNVTAVLSVNNVLDEKYYSRVGGTTVFNFYGQPRSAFMTLKASF